MYMLIDYKKTQKKTTTTVKRGKVQIKVVLNTGYFSCSYKKMKKPRRGENYQGYCGRMSLAKS